MSECDLRREIRQMIKNNNNINEKSICSIVKILKMRHMDLDDKHASGVADHIIKEAKCAK
jgi:hypothetical protein